MKLPTGFVRSANVAGLKWIASLQVHFRSDHIPCGSWLASDRGGSFPNNVGGDGLIAGKPAPTGFCIDLTVLLRPSGLFGAAVLAAWVVLVVITGVVFHE